MIFQLEQEIFFIISTIVLYLISFAYNILVTNNNNRLMNMFEDFALKSYKNKKLISHNNNRKIEIGITYNYKNFTFQVKQFHNSSNI